MPTTARCLLAGFTAAALAAAPASASADVTVPTACPDLPVSQEFAAWGDDADYLLAPDGGFEGASAGWALQGEASVVRADDPLRVGDPSDRQALRMREGSSATSAPFCIGAEHRTMRFLARATPKSSMDVDVLYGDGAAHIGTISGDGGWSPTDILPMKVDALAAARGTTMTVRLRFTPRDKHAWTIDDVLVDPYRSR